MKRLANTSLNARMLFCRICLDYKEFVHTFVADGSAVTFRRPGADGSAVTFRRPGATHKAHWMAPILYTLKVALTEKTIVRLPAGTVNVAWNDLQLMK